MISIAYIKNPAMSFCSLHLNLSNDMCLNTVALKLAEIDSFVCRVCQKTEILSLSRNRYKPYFAFWSIYPLY